MVCPPNTACLGRQVIVFVHVHPLLFPTTDECVQFNDFCTASWSGVNACKGTKAGPQLGGRVTQYDLQDPSGWRAPLCPSLRAAAAGPDSSSGRGGVLVIGRGTSTRVEVITGHKHFRSSGSRDVGGIGSWPRVSDGGTGWGCIPAADTCGMEAQTRLASCTPYLPRRVPEWLSSSASPTSLFSSDSCPCNDLTN